MKEFVKKSSPWVSLGLVVLLVFMLGYGIKLNQVVKTGYNVASGQSSLGSLLEEIIDAKLEPVKNDLEDLKYMMSSRNQYAVQLIFMEVRSFTTAEEVDCRFDYLQENAWNAQNAALKCLAIDVEARKNLSDLIVDEDVEEAVLRRIQMLY